MSTVFACDVHGGSGGAGENSKELCKLSSTRVTVNLSCELFFFVWHILSWLTNLLSSRLNPVSQTEPRLWLTYPGWLTAVRNIGQHWVYRIGRSVLMAQDGWSWSSVLVNLSLIRDSVPAGQVREGTIINHLPTSINRIESSVTLCKGALYQISTEP